MAQRRQHSCTFLVFFFFFYRLGIDIRRPGNNDQPGVWGYWKGQPPELGCYGDLKLLSSWIQDSFFFPPRVEKFILFFLSIFFMSFSELLLSGDSVTLIVNPQSYFPAATVMTFVSAFFFCSAALLCKRDIVSNFHWAVIPTSCYWTTTIKSLTGEFPPRPVPITDNIGSLTSFTLR